MVRRLILLPVITNIDMSLLSELPATDATKDRLRGLFRERFSAKTLSPDAMTRLRAFIEGRLGRADARGEGYLAAANQRDMSVVFHWGHDHWFSDDFALSGRMGERHIDIIARFVDGLGLPIDLRGKRVLDIGCWTGGMPLLLTAMGASVTTLEEVRKYAHVVNVMAEAFGVADRLACLPESLYEALPRFADEFDFVIYAGVVYHVTDPILSLRRAFGALRDGGRCFVESAAMASDAVVCAYHGPTMTLRQSGDARTGWNYFLPSPPCLEAWLEDVGFEASAVGPVIDGRVHGAGTRTRFVDMMRAGLAARDCR